MGDLRFDGRVVLITGAAAGLGRATALAFAARGARLAVCDRDAERLGTLVDQMAPEWPAAISGILDVRDAAAVDAFVADVVDQAGALDVVVNNAGGTFRALFADTAPKGEAALIAENFTSVTAVIRACLPHLGAGSSIVNVTSIEAHRGAPQFGIYAAMKAAVENLTCTLAVELGHRGVRVNAVAPDAIPTDADLFLGAELVGGGADHTTPLGRLGAVEEICGPILFLASDLASFVTGTTLHVDGGNDAARGWRRQPDGTFAP